MNRQTVIQKIIDKINARSYLEIGIFRGNVIFNIEAQQKWGIDPILPHFVKNKKDGKAFFQGVNLFETTSDVFFESHASSELKNGVDVVFIDGLHSYAQSLKDVNNCLTYLNDEGVIIMHDCNPLSAAIGYPIKDSPKELFELAEKGEIPGWNGCWTGDVWKTLVHMRIESDNLEIFTLDIDWGIGIIRKGKCSKVEGISISELESSDYTFLEANRNILLNLKHPKYLEEFLLNL